MPRCMWIHTFLLLGSYHPSRAGEVDFVFFQSRQTIYLRDKWYETPCTRLRGFESAMKVRGVSAGPGTVRLLNNQRPTAQKSIIRTFKP